MVPRVSIVIPCFNIKEYINTAVTSALDQTEKNLEILVVDDGSTDGTPEVVRQISDQRIKLFVNSRNRGPSFARNEALKYARGEWVAFLDGDDWYAPQRVEKLVAAGEKWRVDLVADDLYRSLGPATPPLRRALSRHNIMQPEVFDAIKYMEFDRSLQPIYRRNIIVNNTIRFDEKLKHGEDTLFTLECLLAGGSLLVWPEPFYFYRLRTGSLTSKKVESLQQRLLATKTLMERPDLQQNAKLQDIFQKRLAAAQEELRYYQVIEPLRQGRLGDAVRSGLFRADFLRSLWKAIPKILNHRMRRFRPTH